MRIVDRAIPAAQHLVGPDAIDVLFPPVAAAGGQIESVRPVYVNYRPGSDVVVRYSAQVSWNGAPAVRETLAASSTVHGRLSGTAEVTADTPTGAMTADVWRWPFDPVLAGLAHVTSSKAVARLMDLSDVRLDVVAYRPTERAVIRVTSQSQVAAYVKVVPPAECRAIADRHAALISSGVPAPRVRLMDASLGLLVLEPIHGPTWRELIKSDRGGWPTVTEIDRLADRFASAQVDLSGPAARTTDGALHAEMLATVMPELETELHALALRFRGAPEQGIDGVVHGDLHEGQLIVDHGRIVGILDIDDVGPGASIDDRANLLARLHFRCATGTGNTSRLNGYRAALRASSRRRFDLEQLDLHTAAALIGLATGPFRLQHEGWRDRVAELVGIAEQLSMRELSNSPHFLLTDERAS